MVTLAFPAGSEIVVNLQKPLQEIWLASRSGGYHFRFDGIEVDGYQGAGRIFPTACRERLPRNAASLWFSGPATGCSGIGPVSGCALPFG
jgi:CyaY protein